MIRRYLMVAALVGAAFPAMAGEIVDQITTSSGQLASFTNGPFTSDINIVSAGAEFDGANFTFEANVAGSIGTNPGAAYVFGVNTGTNLAAFAPFMVGESNVMFDTAVILLGNGTGFVFDVLTNSVSAALPNGSVTVNGDRIDAVVPDSLIPSLGGFSPGQYQVDLWTRVGLNGADKTQLADFAPNNMDVPFETPEPASLTLFGVGLAGVAVLARRRKA
jgi:hypothetical protein